MTFRASIGRHNSYRGVVLALVLAAAACGPAAGPSKSVPAPGEWREFEGSWNAAGTRHTIPLGADRSASIIELSGTMLLAGTGVRASDSART